MMLRLALLTLKLCLLLFNEASAGFFSRQQEPPVVPVEIGIRGVPEHLMSKYMIQSNGDVHFTCDNGAKIPKNSVNDNFCDCSDGSDEPGTSACPGMSFYCINQGYRAIKIPSSRIDDGVCDCCDGSDEGNVRTCTNTCNEVAHKEREMLDGMSKAFRAGYEVRAQYVKNVQDKITAELGGMTELQAKSAKLSEELEKMKILLTAEENIEQEEKSKMETEIMQYAAKVIGIDGLTSLDDLLDFAVGVMDVLGLTSAEAVKGVVDTGNSAPRNTENDASEGTDDISDEDMSHNINHGDEYGDHHAYDEDSYDGGESVDPQIGIVPASESESSEKTTTTCNLGLHSSELRLEVLCTDRKVCEGTPCAFDTSLHAVSSLIVKLTKAYSSEKALHLLFGYWRTFGSFEGFDEFADGIEAVVGGSMNGLESCPDKFATKPEVCSIGEELKALNDKQEIVNSYRRDSATTARSNHHRVEAELSEIKRKLDSMVSYAKEVEEFKDRLEFLELKNQCFNAVDGKFTYKLCVLNSIHQSETENGGSVSLGTFKSLTELDDGTFEMKFEHGQHCHAHGPRSSAVKLSCGASNVLKEAAEPSTCFYTFKFESPVACSVKYGKINNLMSNNQI